MIRYLNICSACRTPFEYFLIPADSSRHKCPDCEDGEAAQYGDETEDGL